MILTDAEIADLLPKLQSIAGAVGRNFPRWRVSINDLVQVGFLTIFCLTPRTEDSLQYTHSRQLKAAHNRMIEALRAWQDSRGIRQQQDLPFARQTARKMELIMRDFYHLAENAFPVESSEDILLRKEEAFLKLKRLEAKQRAIAKARMRGETLLSIAQQYQLTEGRLSQLEKQIIEKLQEAA